uniref:Uncharacterized protein n=2 Tax=Brassica oleracea TaxID=3712 RepID=A0A0D3CNZ0_BRAOL
MQERERESSCSERWNCRSAMRLRKEQQLMWLQPWNLTKQTMEMATMLITS